MDDSQSRLLLFLALLGLLALSAFFSASEVAYLSLSASKVRSLAEGKKSRGAKLLLQLRSRPQRFLAAILIASNTTNTAAAGLATYIALDIFGNAGLALVTGALSVLLLTFTDIFPKALAQKHAASFGLFAAYPLWLLDKGLLPITWFFEKFLHMAGAHKPMKTMTEEELLAMVEIGTEEGEIKEHERELIHNVLEFTDTRVESIMLPRVDMVAVDKNQSLADIERLFADQPHSRIPVYDGTIDRVIGICTLRIIFEHRMQGDARLRVGDIEMLEPIFTTASRPIRALLQEMLSRRVHMAIVIDEHGGTEGLITLEDILEELVGEIEDEEDVRDDVLRQINSKTVLTPGDTSLWDIDERLGTTLASEAFENKNVAFLILEKLGRLPKKNDRLRYGGAEITVEEVRQKRIEKVKIEKL